MVAFADKVKCQHAFEQGCETFAIVAANVTINNSGKDADHLKTIRTSNSTHRTAVDPDFFDLPDLLADQPSGP